MVKSVKILNKSGNEWFNILRQVKWELNQIGIWYRKIVSIQIKGEYLHVEVYDEKTAS